jgi:hypothetical protein
MHPGSFHYLAAFVSLAQPELPLPVVPGGHSQLKPPCSYTEVVMLTTPTVRTSTSSGATQQPGGPAASPAAASAD